MSQGRKHSDLVPTVLACVITLAVGMFALFVYVVQTDQHRKEQYRGLKSEVRAMQTATIEGDGK